MTDSAGRNLDEDFALSRDRLRPVAELKGRIFQASDAGEQQGLHGLSCGRESRASAREGFGALPFPL